MYTGKLNIVGATWGLVYFALAGTTPPEKYTIRAFPTPRVTDRRHRARYFITLGRFASFKIKSRNVRTDISAEKIYL